MNNLNALNLNVGIISVPKYVWRCQLHPGTFWMVEDHRVPNWFHRKMQELCFGIIWEKIG